MSFAKFVPVRDRLLVASLYMSFDMEADHGLFMAEVSGTMLKLYTGQNLVSPIRCAVTYLRAPPRRTQPQTCQGFEDKHDQICPDAPGLHRRRLSPG